MKKNDIGVDVSSWQPSDLTNYRNWGSKFAIVKITEGSSYINPNAIGQIRSANALGMELHGYFYANFSNNATQAVAEAQRAVLVAKNYGLPKGHYLATDFEDDHKNNIVYNTTLYNTNAVLASMDVIANAGYKPMFYTFTNLAGNYIDTERIIAKYPNSLWIADYHYGDELKPNHEHFPSMNGVALWQFTNNWRGVGVDASVCMLELNNSSVSQAAKKEDDLEMSWHVEIDPDELGRFMVTNPNGAQLYTDSTLTTKIVGQGKNVKRDYGQKFKVAAIENGAVKAGTNQWFSQSDGSTKVNPLYYNKNAKGVQCRISVDKAFTQHKAQSNQAGVKHLPKGQIQPIYGIVNNDYFLVGSKDDGEYIDKRKTKVILN